MSKNILILSAGRRVELIQCFLRAKERLGEEGKVIAVDISDMAPAIYFADGFYLIPRIAEDGYIDAIISVCKKEQTDLIVPTIDTELLKLSNCRQEIESRTDARLLLSREDVIQICRDKKRTQDFFEEYGFGVPRRLSAEDLRNGDYTFPLFLKPEDGSSSINTFKIRNENELQFFRSYVEKPLIQEFIEGQEFSVDVFCDFDGNPITIVPRERLATRGGEIAKGRIIKDRDIIMDVQRLLAILKPMGHITIQCMKTERGIVYIEINPRFGGGAPMSIAAGADSCENLYRLLRGEKLVYNEDYRENDIFLRFDESIVLDEKMRLYHG